MGRDPVTALLIRSGLGRDWIADFLTDPKRADNLAKLARSGASGSIVVGCDEARIILDVDA